MTAAPAERTFRIAPPGVLSEPEVVRVLAALPRARAVGGVVRDALAGRAVADLDLATPDRPEEVTAALTDAGIRVIPTGLDHGTVTALAGTRPIEITTLRRDVATDGRRATVAFTDDWREDAARRDFTINAMSMEPDGTVHDWFGGFEDLAAGRVRFVGDPATRLAEDHLRALRFFRFQARYGRGEPDGATLAAIAEAAPLVGRLSAERLWSELKRILAAPDPEAAIALMRRTGVLGSVLPEATAEAALAGLVRAGAPADPLLRLAALAPGETDALAKRLRLSGAEAERLEALRGPVPAPEADDATLRRALAEVLRPSPHAVLADRAWLAEARGVPGDWARLRARLSAIPVPDFPLSGGDVVARGVPPGPRVGALLESVRGWWLAGGCVADRKACLDRLEAVVLGS
jgi:poly(A) polymerase/tRNA nucleotidyltransferase (CCA-adding enzyme)